MEPRRPLKPLFWMGSSRKDLKSFPAEVQDEMGYALRDAQFGGQRMNVQVLKGFRGAGVLEVIENFDGNTYMKLIRARLKAAEEHYLKWRARI